MKSRKFVMKIILFGLVFVGLCAGVAYVIQIYLATDLSRTVILPSPLKGITDKKDYRLVRLENGIEVLLASSESGVSACSLSVNVGAFSDPKDFQGLAHFTEHTMLQAGSKEHPNDDFQRFIRTLGAKMNARTFYEQTIYYFSIQQSKFEVALARFVSIFTPESLISFDALTASQSAVESEFELKKHRYRTPLLLNALGRTGHPSRSFIMGNLATQNASTLFSEVQKFVGRHYAAQRMKIYLQSRESLDELQAMAEKFFLQIQNNTEVTDDFTAFKAENAYMPGFRQIFFKQEFRNQIEMIWVLPSLFDKYRSKPHKYLTYVIEHKGEGSLHGYLMHRKVALGVEANMIESNSVFGLFRVSIELTPKGVKEIPEVLRAVSSYIRMLRGKISEELFNELKWMERIKFQYKDERSERDNALEMAFNMQHYEPRNILGGPTLFYEFNETQIQSMIDLISSRSFNTIITTSVPFDGISYNLTHWSGFTYGAIDFPSSWKEAWDRDVLTYSFKLPQHNKFIPRHFDVLATPETSPYPVKILDEIWFQLDTSVPHVFINFYLKSDLSGEVKFMATLTLMAHILQHRVDNSYQAVGFRCDIQPEEFGLILRMSGFSDKIHLVVEHFKDVVGNLSMEVLFEEFKQNLMLKYLNDLDPKQLSNEIRKSIVLNSFTTPELYWATGNITFDDFSQFSRKFFNNLDIKGLIQGNIMKENALELTQSFRSLTSPNKQTKEIFVRQIPEGAHHFRVKSIHPNNNTIVINYYQLGIRPEMKEILYDIVTAMQSPATQTLRFKKHLGYFIFVDFLNDFGMLGYTITVIGHQYPASKIDIEIEKFRETFLSELPFRSFSSGKFVFRSLAKRVNWNWEEIVSGRNDFEQNSRQIEEYEEGIRLIRRRQTRKLSIQVVGSDEEVDVQPKMRELDRRLRELKTVSHHSVIKVMQPSSAAARNLNVVVSISIGVCFWFNL